MKTAIKIIGVVLLIVAGFGIFLFSPFNTMKSTKKIAQQVRIVSLSVLPDTKEQQLKSAPNEPKSATRSTPVLAPTPVAQSVSPVDILIKYGEKFIGLASSSIGLVIGLRTIKNRKPATKPTTKPARRKKPKTWDYNSALALNPKLLLP